MYEVVSFVRKFLTSVLLAGLEREKHSGQTRGWRRGGGGEGVEEGGSVKYLYFSHRR